MPYSSLGWIDFSSEHREKVKMVLDFLNTQGVIDELGVGIIRDAFSDFLFPGLSSIQTRAKYFTIIPRIFKDYEQLPNKNKANISLQEYLRVNENECMRILSEIHEYKEGLGIIGVTLAKYPNKELQRKPSSIYWNGLRKYKIIDTSLSLKEFCEKNSGKQKSLRLLLQETKEEKGDDYDADQKKTSLVRTIPDHTSSWKEHLTIELTENEAEFLHQQMIIPQCHYSLISQVLLNDDYTTQFLSLRDIKPQYTFSTLRSLPFIKGFRESNVDLFNAIQYADDFWCLMFGAHIRYNCLLQERHGDAEKREEFKDLWDKWRDEIARFSFAEWSIDDFWRFVNRQRPNISPKTVDFVNDWYECCKEDCIDIDKCNSLVINQEIYNKGKRARLRKSNNDLSVKKWIGISSLSYRLPQALRIVFDIKNPQDKEI